MSDAEFGPAAELARRLKQQLVGAWREGDNEQECDLLPMAMAIREGKVIAQVMAPSGPLGPRYAVKAAALFFRSDEVWVMTDSIMWSAKGEKARQEAERVRPGQMVDAWRAGKRKGLTEAIMACRMTKSGDTEMQSWPYLRTGNKVEFREPVFNNEFGFEGAIPDYAAEGFSEAEEKWPELEKVIKLAAAATGVDDFPEYIDRGASVFVSDLLDTGVLLYDHRGSFFPPLVYANGQRVEDIRV